MKRCVHWQMEPGVGSLRWSGKRNAQRVRLRKAFRSAVPQCRSTSESYGRASSLHCEGQVPDVCIAPITTRLLGCAQISRHFGTCTWIVSRMQQKLPSIGKGDLEREASLVNPQLRAQVKMTRP